MLAAKLLLRNSEIKFGKYVNYNDRANDYPQC